MSLLLLFVDGIGIGDDDPLFNPFPNADLPVLRQLTAGHLPTRSSVPCLGPEASVLALDATLGVDGIPQSGTGQATLLTGVNAAARLGRHQGPWIPTALRQLVRDENVLARARAAGKRVAFANAYPEEVLRSEGEARLPSDADSAAPGAGPVRSRRERRGAGFLRAGPPLAALGAGVLNRHTPELERGDAVASEITNEGWRAHLGRTSLPAITAATAGANLARIAADHDLTLFAHYATDYAGHGRDMEAACAALERLDAFIGGVLAALPRDTLLFLMSDHGNIEDVRVGHTRNPALCVLAGAGHAAVAARLHSLVDVTPVVLRTLGVAATHTSTADPQHPA